MRLRRPEGIELAFKRAAHSAFMCPVEAEDLKAGIPLTNLSEIGPSLARRIQQWGDSPPKGEPPPHRPEFLTVAQARKVLPKNPRWHTQLKGDLQMYTEWSDGADTIQDMANAALERDYQYIGITDHTKSLKIAGGLDEHRLEKQRMEFAAVNRGLRKQDSSF